MAETESEKLLKDSINGWRERDQILGGFLIKDPQYQSHPIDAVVVPEAGEPHLVEVKETKSTSVTYTDFSDRQIYLISMAKNSWVLVRFYQDVNRNSSRFAEDYYLVPGDLAPAEAGAEGIRFTDCEEDDRIRLVARETKGHIEGIDEVGITSRGNPTRGFIKLPPILIDDNH